MNRPSENLRFYALALCGLPYIWGGDDPVRGFDCSGLVQELLASEGLDPAGDQTAQGLHDYFVKRGVQNHKGLGALVFYGRSTREITHVGMMLNEYQIVEAGGGGSKTVSAEAAAVQNAFVRIRPYDRRGDVVAIINPFVVANGK